MVAEGRVDVEPARHELSAGQVLHITAASRQSVGFRCPKVVWKVECKPDLEHLGFCLSRSKLPHAGDGRGR